MSSDWLPCDCLVKLQCDEEINVVHGYETIGDAKEEPCLECALLIALQGDDLDKADICLEYGGSPNRCVHCVAQGNICSPIRCERLRIDVLAMMVVCRLYFYHGGAETPDLFKIVNEHQDKVLESYDLSEDKNHVSAPVSAL
ncbi:hypothetical protein FVEN_g9664 [Fusarium venenatum]|nr:hypothetical protein FVEN_g9664 [Fusarium venenatum]